MNNRGDVLALASALSGGDEVTLGPTDMAICAAALRFYANEQTKAGMLKLMKVPALLAAVFMGFLALGGSSIGNTEVSMMELAPAHFESFARSTLKPLPHTSPESLEMQRYATAYPNEG
ncbi:hypothetical protein [Bradyrhizobium elkanii]|uniref:hypothetical protein n=1 Tax=Bradyrhizobium elkanii TaxID=29448 RepID=UPI00272974A2|nr:hypothetical protein [Bradyrhizobium elkanii]WLA86868.1 hypothetical protein QNJ99_23195 [Bradyrhizobium elkanii]